MKESIWLVETTVESDIQAKNLAQEAVSGGYAACAQVDAPIKSYYIWKGELENAIEYRIHFKLSEKNLTTLIDWLKQRHPYDCPQILVSKPISANPEYTKWVNQD